MPGDLAAVNNYLVLGALLFVIGAVGFLTRRNMIILFLCVELMFQGVTLTLVGFASYRGTWSGQVLALMSLAVAAGEAAIALALVVALFRRTGSLDVSLWQELREPDQPPLIDDDVPFDPETPTVWPKLTLSGLLPSRRPDVQRPARALSTTATVTTTSADQPPKGSAT